MKVSVKPLLANGLAVKLVGVNSRSRTLSCVGVRASSIENRNRYWIGINQIALVVVPFERVRDGRVAWCLLLGGGYGFIVLADKKYLNTRLQSPYPAVTTDKTSIHRIFDPASESLKPYLQ